MAIGRVSDAWADRADAAITPLLALLLYVTFLQVDVAAIPRALGDRRFLAASLAGNFVAIPLLVAGLTWLVPLPPAVQLGVVLVLLAPCTDWFISFTHLGRGDTRLAIAVTPLLLLLQFPLVAVFLGLLTNVDPWGLPQDPILQAVALVVAVPLGAALLTQRITGHGRWVVLAERTMTPLLAIVLLMVAAASSALVLAAVDELLRAAAVFIAYVLVVPILAWGLGRGAHLSGPASRTLLFNLGTRNSFVMLPIALALPAEFSLAAPIIAAQSLVELLAMLAYLRLARSRWFPSGVAQA